MLERIEKNAIKHFIYLSRLGGYSVYRSGILTIVNCGLGSPLFNIVCDTHLEEWARAKQDKALFEDVSEGLGVARSRAEFLGMVSDANTRYGEDLIKEKIREVIDAFKGQSFSWWLGPSCDPFWLPYLLSEMGFEDSTNEYAMALDLSEYRSDSKILSEQLTIRIEQLKTVEQLEHFIQIKEIGESSARQFYEQLKPWMLNEQEMMFVGYLGNIPVVTGALYHQEDTTGIYSLYTDPSQRGHTFGTQMVHHLVRASKTTSSRHVTLLTSLDSGYQLFEQIGFKSYGGFKCMKWGRG